MYTIAVTKNKDLPSLFQEHIHRTAELKTELSGPHPMLFKLGFQTEEESDSNVILVQLRWQYVFPNLSMLRSVSFQIFSDLMTYSIIRNFVTQYCNRLDCMYFRNNFFIVSEIENHGVKLTTRKYWPHIVRKNHKLCKMGIDFLRVLMNEQNLRLMKIYKFFNWPPLCVLHCTYRSGFPDLDMAE